MYYPTFFRFFLFDLADRETSPETALLLNMYSTPLNHRARMLTIKGYQENVRVMAKVWTRTSGTVLKMMVLQENMTEA